MFKIPAHTNSGSFHKSFLTKFKTFSDFFSQIKATKSQIEYEWFSKVRINQIVLRVKMKDMMIATFFFITRKR